MTYIPTPAPFHADPAKAPTFLASVPSSIVFNDRSQTYTSRHRAYFEERGLSVPSLLDIERERSRRRALRPGAVEHAHTEGGTAFVHPMLSDTPSPMWLNRLNRRDRERERRERRRDERQGARNAR